MVSPPRARTLGQHRWIRSICFWSRRIAGYVGDARRIGGRLLGRCLRSPRFWLYSPLLAAMLGGVLLIHALSTAGFFDDPPKALLACQGAVRFSTAYARWSIDIEAGCPESIEELVPFLTDADDARDPWGNDFVMLCGEDAPAEAYGFAVISRGKDGELGTADDIQSWACCDDRRAH